MSKAAAQPLPAQRKAELMHRLSRTEGHALDSSYLRRTRSVAEQELQPPSPEGAQRVTEVLDRLQSRLGRSR